MEHGTSGRFDPPPHAALEKAWNSALSALEQLGFSNVSCVLRHDRLPTGLCVLRSGAAISHVVDRVTRELPSRLRPGGFTISLGAAHAVQTAGWVLVPTRRCAQIQPERKIEAKRVAIQSYDQFMRILDERPDHDVEPKHLSERERVPFASGPRATHPTHCRADRYFASHCRVSLQKCAQEAWRTNA